MKLRILIIIALLLLPIVYLFSPLDIFPLTPYDMTSVASEKTDPAMMTYHEYLDTLQKVDVQGGEMTYLDMGSPNDPVVLLIHGAPTSSWMYRQTVTPLINSGYRVIVPDLLGWGASDKPDGQANYSVEQQAGRILTLMKSLKINNWTHVMHDLGGLWTRELMTQLDTLDTIESLVVLNTIGFSEGFAPPLIMEYLAGLGKPYAKLISIDPLSETIMKQTVEMMVNDISLADDQTVDGYLYPMMDGGRKTYGYFLKELGTVRDRLEGYKTFFEKNKAELPPATIIWGMQDVNLVGQVQIPFFESYFDVTDVTTIDDGVHLIPEEFPEIIVDAIIKS